jgi:hypothetical protein
VTAARIASRLVRKLAKPVALYLNARALRDAEDQADFYMHLRASIVDIEKRARVRTVQLIGRRNQIRGW